jgi:hypothetical protein
MLPWAHAYWTEGTDFEALAYSNGAEVTSFPDEITTLDAVPGTAPIYAAATAPLNGQPAVIGDGTRRLLTAAPAVNISQPVSVVVVGYHTAAGLATDGRTAANRIIVQTTGSPPTLQVYGGSSFRSGPTSQPYFYGQPFVAAGVVNGASTKINVGGVDGVSGSAGTSVFAGATLVGRHTATPNTNGGMSFVGIYPGDVTTDPDWLDFLDAVADHYGTPVVTTPVSSFSDDFDRPDSNYLGRSWLQLGATPWTIVGEQLIPSSIEHLRLTQPIASVDHYAQHQVAFSGTNDVALCLRGDFIAHTYYMGRYYGNSGAWEIYRRVAGAFTLLASSVASVSSPATYRFGAITNGSGDVELTLSSVTAGVPTSVLTFTDSSASKLTTSPYVGLRKTGSPIAVDNFQAGLLD